MHRHKIELVTTADIVEFVNIATNEIGRQYCFLLIQTALIKPRSTARKTGENFSQQKNNAPRRRENIVVTNSHYI